MPTRSSLRTFLVAMLGTAAGAQSQWERTHVGAAAPTARAEHALAEDFARRQIVLFGGRMATGQLLDDTWLWSGSSWQRALPVNRPPARRNAMLAWHSGRSRVVLFGGVDTQGAALDDLWEWNGVDWARGAAVTPRPTARAAAGLASGTSDGALWLFGGIDALGAVHGDTWRWDGASWQLLSFGTAPDARFGHRLVGDPARARLVLHGGSSGGSDTWSFDGLGWTRVVAVAAPGPRLRHAMSWDGARGRVVLHGGTDGFAYALNDTWEFDGAAWTTRATAALPTGGVDAAMAYDTQRERTVLFGGFDGFNASDAFWSFGAIQPAVAVAFGAGCSGSAGVPRLALRDWDRPWLGETFFQQVDQVPTAAPMALHVGFSRASFGGRSLPLALDFIGMNGCELLVSIDAIGIVQAVAGVASLPLSVPQSSALVGARFFSQALVIDPFANAAGVTATNALEFVIGTR